MSFRSIRQSWSKVSGIGDFKEVFRWTVGQLWQCSRRLTVSLIASTLVNSLIPALSTLAIGLLIQSLTASAEGGESITFVSSGSPAFWISVVMVLFLIGTLLDELMQFFSNRLSDELSVHVQKKLYVHASELDLSFFEDADSLDKVFRFRSGISRGLLAPVLGAINFASGLLQAISLVGLMVWFAPVPALLLLLSAIPVAIAQTVLTRQKYELEIQTTRRKRWANYVTNLITDPNIVPTIKIFGLSGILLDKFTGVQEEVNALRSILHRRRVRWVTIVTLIFFTVFFAVMLWMINQMSVGLMTGTALATFGLAAFRARSAVWKVIRSAANVVDSTLVINHILEFLDTEPKVSPIDDKVSSSDGSALLLDSVTFKYPSQELPAIRNLSLEIPHGQKLAIVGQNGAGKSTLMKLICRLYDADEGMVSLGGIDVREFPLEELYRRFSIVQQWPAQFEGTVRENLAFGDWERYAANPDELDSDLRSNNQIPDFVSSLRDGLDTKVGRAFSRVTLSGGQWQQLAITRALARRDAILILDEPTANLDALAEKTLFERICTLAEQRTVILVSHRFSTVRMVDRIIVLDDGEIVEDGSHEALMGQDGLYAHMYRVYHGL